MPRIHILGASGSGTTTLGGAVAAHLAIPHFDADSVYWMPTDPPFTTPRLLEERIALLDEHLPASEDWVFSGSAVGWSEAVEPRYDLIVFLRLAQAVRLDRLKRREEARYGDRIRAGGDMEAVSARFFTWAAGYETAGLEQRSLVTHERWLARQRAPVLRLDSTEPVGALAAAVLAATGRAPPATGSHP